MTKPTRIIVKSDVVVGSDFKSNKCINLTSAPHAVVNAILLTIPDLPKKLKFINLSNSNIFNSRTGVNMIDMKKKNAVTFIIDVDDTHAHLKIRNICSINSLTPATIVTMDASMRRKKQKHDEISPGKIIRIGSWQHDKSVLSLINCTTITLTNVKGMSNVVVVKTGDKLCGSVAAIIIYLRMNGIKYTIETIIVKYEDTWITGSKKINKLRFTSNKSVTDELPGKDSMWAFKLGYASYLSTNKGAMKVILDDSKVESWLDKIVSYMASITDKIIQFFKNLFNGPTASTEVATTIIDVLPEISTHICAMRMASVSKNASSDIKKANKVIARMQLNKMLARSGIGGDKTILSSKLSEPFESYMAGMTSYNMTEAVATANNMASSHYRNSKFLLLSLLIVTIIICCILTSSYINLIVSLTLIIIDYFTDMFKGSALFYVLAMILSTSVVSFVVNAAFAMAETIIKDDKTTVIRSVVWSALRCLIYLI